MCVFFRWFSVRVAQSVFGLGTNSVQPRLLEVAPCILCVCMALRASVAGSQRSWEGVKSVGGQRFPYMHAFSAQSHTQSCSPQLLSQLQASCRCQLSCSAMRLCHLCGRFSRCQCKSECHPDPDPVSSVPLSHRAPSAPALPHCSCRDARC